MADSATAWFRRLLQRHGAVDRARGVESAVRGKDWSDPVELRPILWDWKPLIERQPRQSSVHASLRTMTTGTADHDHATTYRIDGNGPGLEIGKWSAELLPVLSAVVAAPQMLAFRDGIEHTRQHRVEANAKDRLAWRCDDVGPRRASVLTATGGIADRVDRSAAVRVDDHLVRGDPLVKGYPATSAVR